MFCFSFILYSYNIRHQRYTLSMKKTLLRLLILIVLLSSYLGCELRPIDNRDEFILLNPPNVDVEVDPAPPPSDITPGPEKPKREFGELYIPNDTAKFDEWISKAGNEHVVFLYFSQYACAPCKTQKPIIQELAKENTDILFIQVDHARCPEVFRRYNVTTTPTMLFRRERWVQFKTKEFLSNAVRNKNFKVTAIDEVPSAD